MITARCYDVVAFSYDGDFHCIACTERQYGPDMPWIEDAIEDFSPVFRDELDDYVYTTSQQWHEQGEEYELLEAECGNCRELIQR